MGATDPNAEWIGNVQPVGLVLAATVLARHGLNPAEQTRADSEVVGALLSDNDQGPALPDPWEFFTQILGWRAAQVAGVSGGSALPADLSVRVEESGTDLRPHWAVVDPGRGWQILVRIEGPGVDPEQRGALEGWEATPHQQLERLLRETGVPTGLLLTDSELRFIHAPRGETSGWLKFPLRSLSEVGGRPMLGGLKLILSSFRLHNDAPDRRLTSLLKASREAQAEVSTRLAAQVLGALYELLRGLHSADRPRIEGLAASRPDHLYEGLLTVLLRLVFLLYAEDRTSSRRVPTARPGRSMIKVTASARSMYACLKMPPITPIRWMSAAVRGHAFLLSSDWCTTAIGTPGSVGAAASCLIRKPSLSCKVRTARPISHHLRRCRTAPSSEFSTCCSASKESVCPTGRSTLSR